MTSPPSVVVSRTVNVRRINGHLCVTWALPRGYLGDAPLIAYGSRMLSLRERLAWHLLKRMPSV